MTMTSGVGTPFFMAPEMATGTKHYTGAVDVYSFAIMAAQVLSGRLVYDSSDSFDTSYGLCFHWSFTYTQGKAQKHCVCDWFVFSLGSCSLSSIATHTAFVNAVCQGLRPRVSGCSAEMKTLVSACWDANASCRPCLSSFSPLFHLLTLLSCPFFHSSLPLLHAHTPAFDAIVDTLSALH